MHFRPHSTIVAIMALLSVLSCSKPKLSERVRGSLMELDGYVASRSVYETRKKGQLDALRKLLNASIDSRRRLNLSKELVEEYFAYNFDSTQYYLKNCLALAESLGDKEEYYAASIKLGHLYAKAGHFMEAHDRLYELIDEAELPKSLRTDYLFTLFDFSRDLAGNSGMVERLSIPDRSVYREELYSLCPLSPTCA